MTHSQIQEIVVLSREFNGIASGRFATIYTMLKRYEATLRRIAENDNTRQLTPKEIKKRDSIQSKVGELVKELGCTKVEFNGDSRGSNICLYIPSGRYNSFDGETWRIN